MKTVVLLVDSQLMVIDTFKDAETARYYIKQEYTRKEWFESELSLTYAEVDQNNSIIEYGETIDLYG